MASIVKRPNGRWRARLYVGGEQTSRDFGLKLEARQWVDTMTADVQRGEWAAPEHQRQAFHDFALEWAAVQDWKPLTREDFPRVLARLDAALPARATLGSVDSLTVRRVRQKLADKYAPATVKLTTSRLTTILRAAHQARRIPRDPTVGTASRRATAGRRVGPGDIPTRDEVLAIWHGAPERFRAAVALGATGLRVGEVLGLTADRVDVAGRQVTVDRQLQRLEGTMTLTTPKREKPRTVTVPELVAAELGRHLELVDDGLLFVGGRGAPLRRDEFYKVAWRPALEAAGLPADRYVFHSLRHFCASSMLAAGVNPAAVAGYLGDRLETLTRTYAHWLRDDVTVPADALERILRTD